MHIVGVVLNLKISAFLKLAQLIPAEIGVIHVAVAVLGVAFGNAAHNGKHGAHLFFFQHRLRKLHNAFKAVVKGNHDNFFRQLLFSVNKVNKILHADRCVAFFFNILKVAPQFVRFDNVFSGALCLFGNVVIHHNGQQPFVLGCKNLTEGLFRLERKEERDAQKAENSGKNMKLFYADYHIEHSFGYKEPLNKSQCML